MLTSHARSGLTEPAPKAKRAESRPPSRRMVMDKPLGFIPGDHYRFVPQWRIVNMLLLYGFSYDAVFLSVRDYLDKKIDLWVSQGLPYRPGPDGQRLFDPAEVNNFVRLAAFNDQDDFVSAHLMPDHRRMMEHLVDQAVDGECRMTLEFKRTFSLEGIAPGTKLRLRAPAPVGGKYLKHLETKPWVQAAGSPEVIARPGRLEARIVAAGEPFATLGARFDFTVLEEKEEVVEADRQLYLKDEEGLIVVSPKIREMARTLSAPGAPALEAIRAFWEHINGEMIFGSVHYDQIDMTSPSEWIAEHGWYDCQTGAALLAALCRASGIPARVVCGYLIYHRAPVMHFWMEACLENGAWTPFDLMSWDLSLGGRDAAWRDRLFAKIDFRLVLERMPREFTGALGLPLPSAWILLPQAEHGGVGNHFLGIDGRPLYADFLRVTS